MISSIEMQRTEGTSSEKYMAIGWERNNEDYHHTPLNSEFYVMAVYLRSELTPDNTGANCCCEYNYKYYLL